MKDFGEQLIQARKAAGMTQQQLADAIHVTRTAVSHWESGRHQPDLDTIQQLSKVLQYSFSFLPTGDSAPDAPAGGSMAEPAAEAGSTAAVSDESGQGPAVSSDEAAGSDDPQSAADPSSSAPPARKRPLPWILACVGVLAVFLVILFTVILPAQNQTSDDYVSANDSSVHYHMADFTKTLSPEEGKAFLVISTETEVNQGDNMSFFLYRFIPKETQGIALDVTDCMVVYLTNDGKAHPFFLSPADLKEASIDPHIPARGSFTLDGGFALEQKTMKGIGFRIETVDENGVEQTFTAYIPYPTEYLKP